MVTCKHCNINYNKDIEGAKATLLKGIGKKPTSSGSFIKAIKQIARKQGIKIEIV